MFVKKLAVFRRGILHPPLRKDLPQFQMITYHVLFSPLFLIEMFIVLMTNLQLHNCCYAEYICLKGRVDCLEMLLAVIFILQLPMSMDATDMGILPWEVFSRSAMCS